MLKHVRAGVQERQERRKRIEQRERELQEQELAHAPCHEKVAFTSMESAPETLAGTCADRPRIWSSSGSCAKSRCARSPRALCLLLQHALQGPAAAREGASKGKGEEAAAGRGASR